MKIAGTGHRPSKLFRGNVYAPENQLVLVAFAEEQLKKFLNTYRNIEVISGMALGWDQALGQASVNLGVDFHAYIPFPGQDSPWPPTSRERYARLLAEAKSVRIISSYYSPAAMQERNIAMVRDCQVLLALWDGSSGGTGNCVQWAQLYAKKVQILNVWADWVQFR